MTFLLHTLAFVGLYAILPTLWYIYRLLSLKYRAKSVRLESLGKWAVITGSTDGIGRAVAVQCARKGMNVFLIGRNEAKLEQVKSEITDQCKHSTVSTALFDFGAKAWDENKFNEIKKTLESLDIGFLVCSAGVGYPSALKLEELPENVLEDIVSVNVTGTFKVVRAVLPGMRQRKRGAIVCVGSGASLLPTEPLYAAYVGSKAAVDAFCRSLQAETIQDKVMVMCVAPMLVATKLSKIKRPSLTVPAPAAFCKDLLAAVESTGALEMQLGSLTTSPNVAHSIILMVATAVPLYLWNMIRTRMVGDLRRRYLAKLEKQQAQQTTN